MKINVNYKVNDDQNVNVNQMLMFFSKEKSKVFCMSYNILRLKSTSTYEY